MSRLRGKRITIRVSESEVERIKQGAEQYEMTVSDYMRKCALNAGKFAVMFDINPGQNNTANATTTTFNNAMRELL